MRTLLTTTALVALMSMGAVAQDATNPNLLSEGYQVIDTDGLASKLLGFPVYTGPNSDAEKLGEINDIVIGQSGEVSAVILGVGGFLGVGEKNVAVNYEDLQWVVAEDDTERLVLEVDRAALETAAAVELVDDEPADTAAAQTPAADQPANAGDDATETAAAPAPAEPADTDEATETAAAPAADQPATEDDAMETAQAPADTADDESLETGTVTTPGATPADPDATSTMEPINRDLLVDLDEMTLTAEELTGTNVYGPEDQHIGVIGDFVLGEDGKAIDAVIIDFGGFLGIGTKEVAVAFENLDFYADENGNNRYLLLNVNREQMEAAPAFNRDTYAQERDAQRLVLDGSVTPETAAN